MGDRARARCRGSYATCCSGYHESSDLCAVFCCGMRGDPCGSNIACCGSAAQNCNAGDCKNGTCTGFLTGCTSSCFVAGTAITIADGTKKPIEEIAVGDEVLSYDTDLGVPTVGKVTKLLVHPH